MQPKCPPSPQLAAYLAGKLTEVELEAVAAHLEHCSQCEARIETIVTNEDTFVADVRRAHAAETSPNGPTLKLRAAELETLSRLLETAAPAEADSVLEAPRVPAELREYRLLEELGQGGMGTVYRALHTRLEKVVAVKVVRADRMQNAGALARFKREMKAVGKLSHRNIIAAHDAGEVDGTHFLVMEHIEGVDLAELVGQYGPLPPAAACEVIRQAAEGLQHAHEHGMVHRDIKPSNIMVCTSRRTVVCNGAAPHDVDQDSSSPTEPTVKILDLGLASLESLEQDADLTASGQVMGTLAYMAPEQLRGSRNVDIRADIYALGATLFYLLSGRKYNDGTHPANLTSALDQLADEGPAGVLPAIKQMVADGRSDRFSTPAEVAEALAPLCETDALCNFLAGTDGQTAEWHGTQGFASIQQRNSAEMIQSPTSVARLKRGGRRSVVTAAALLLVLLGPSVYFGPAVYRIATNQGQLVIEAQDKDVKVVVKQNGEVVKIVDTKTDRTVTIVAGTYEIELGEGNQRLKLATNQFTLTRNGKQIVKVQSAPLRSPQRERPPDDPENEVISDDGRRELKTLEEALELVTPDDPFDAEGVAVLRDQLVTFGQRYYGAPAALEAARLMSRLQWPADALRREDISEYERMAAGHGDDARVPSELVAVLGNSRLKHWETAVAVAFGPDGKTVHSASANGAFRQWSVSDGRQIGAEVTYGTYPSQVALSPDRTRLAVSIGGRLRLVDRTTGKARDMGEVHSSQIKNIAFDAGGKLIATAASDGAIGLIDFERGLLLKRITGHQGTVAAIAFHPQGQTLASGGWDGTVRLWSLEGDEQMSLPGRAGRVIALAFSPTGETLAANRNDGAVEIWEAETGRHVHVLQTKVEQLWTAALAFAPDGKTLAACTTANEISIWEVASGQLIRILAPCHIVTSLDFSPDGTKLASTDNVSVALWDVATGKRLHEASGFNQRVLAVAVDPGGQSVVSAGDDGTARLWDLETQAVVQTFVEPMDDGWGLNSVALTQIRDHPSIVIGHRSRQVTVWDAGSGKLISTLDDGRRAPSEQTMCVAVSPDGKLIASSGSGRVTYLWQAATRVIVGTIPSGPAIRITFTPDGQGLVTGDATGLVKLWDVSSRDLKQTFTGHRGWVMSVAVSPDGATLASVGFDQTIRLWDIATGRLTFTLTAHTTSGQPNRWSQFASVAFSPDGSLLASSAYDGTVRLWDPKTGAQFKAIRLCPAFGLISQLTFTPEGRHLVTANGNGTVYVLRIAPPAPPASGG